MVAGGGGFGVAPAVLFGCALRLASLFLGFCGGDEFPGDSLAVQQPFLATLLLLFRLGGASRSCRFFAGVQGVLYMALLELHGAGFEYAGGSQKMVPCVYPHLHHTLMESRSRRRMDAKRKRVGSPRDLALMLVESVKDVGTLDWFVRW